MGIFDFLHIKKRSDVCACDSQLTERRREQRMINDSYTADHFIGQRFIFVPNEWEDLTIGKITHIDLERGVVCHGINFVTNQPTFFIGFPLHFNLQRLQALLKLDPFERYALCHPNLYSPDPFIKPKHTPLLSTSEIHARLQLNKFYED